MRRTRSLMMSMPAMLAALTATAPLSAQPDAKDAALLERERAAAERQLHESFTNLQFEDFGPAPVEGPIYQANAGGRMLYYAPESGHILFANIYDRDGVNVTALAQEDRARKQVASIDRNKALILGPKDAPTVIEFTDPDCPHCRDLERFWAAKAATGKPVRRLIYFVAGGHENAARKAEHILCSPDHEAAFDAIYRGVEASPYATCAAGKAKVEDDTRSFIRLGTGATPTIIVDGKILTGFQQSELETFLNSQSGSPAKAGP